MLTGLVSFLSACATVGQPAETFPTATSAAGEGVGVQSTASPESSDPGPLTLSVWIPPAFSPTAGGLAATLLQTRLDAFHEAHPNVQIEVRLKLESGEGGLLDSLGAAQAAAPLALPDLVLLSSDILPLAVDRQLLQPLDAYLSEPLNEDWYDFGWQMVQRSGQTYGLPFAGDALVLLHRLSAVSETPATWQAVLDQPLVLGFAAADPQVIFSLAELSALGDPITHPDSITLEQLESLLAFYAEAQTSGAFPFWLTQFEGQEQSWQAFVEGRLPMVVAWSSRFLTATDANLGAAPLPTSEGQNGTLVRGWAWAITTPDEQRLALSLELAEFLSSPEFLAQWSAAAGFLPPRSSALAAWSPDVRQALASQVVPEAAILPDVELRSAVGGPLSEAVIALLKQEILAGEAAQSVFDALAGP